MSTRDLTSAFKTALSATNCFPVFFVELAFSSFTWRFWTGFNETTWNDSTWFGSGSLVSLSNIQESLTPKGRKLKIMVESVSGAALSLALNNTHINQIGKIWFGLLSDSYGSIISEPYLAYEGSLSSASVDFSTREGTMSLSYESELKTLNLITNYKYDNETQQLFYPGDVGFNHVPKVAEWKGYWGVK